MRRFEIMWASVMSGLCLLATTGLGTPANAANDNTMATGETANGDVQDAPASAPEQIEWAASIKEAKAQADASGAVIMIDFYTTWCGWCSVLEEKTYTDKRVILLSEELVPVQMDAEKEGAKLAFKYHVRSYPTMVFVDAKGTEIQRVVGYQNGNTFTATLAKLVQSRNGAKLQQDAATRPNDMKVLSKLVVINAALRNPSLASRFLQGAETVDPNNASGLLTPGYQSLVAYYMNEKKYDMASDYLRQQIAASRTEHDTVMPYLMLGYCDVWLGQPVEGMAKFLKVTDMESADAEEKALARKLLVAVQKQRNRQDPDLFPEGG